MIPFVGRVKFLSGADIISMEVEIYPTLRYRQPNTNKHYKINKSRIRYDFTKSFEGDTSKEELIMGYAGIQKRMGPPTNHRRSARCSTPWHSHPRARTSHRTTFKPRHRSTTQEQRRHQRRCQHEGEIERCSTSKTRTRAATNERPITFDFEIELIV